MWCTKHHKIHRTTLNKASFTQRNTKTSNHIYLYQRAVYNVSICVYLKCLMIVSKLLLILIFLHLTSFLCNQLAMCTWWHIWSSGLFLDRNLVCVWVWLSVIPLVFGVGVPAVSLMTPDVVCHPDYDCCFSYCQYTLSKQMFHSSFFSQNVKVLFKPT